MYNKYFTVDVAPLIPASLQNSAFVGGDVLFDWTPFQVPKGSSALHSAVALVRPKGNAAATINNFGFNLIFSKSKKPSLGTANSVPAQTPSNDILGFVEFEAANYAHANMSSTAVATMGKASNSGRDNPVLVLTGYPDSGDNVGYDTLYVAAIATGGFDFRSIHLVAANAAAGTTVVVDAVSDLTFLEHFIPGDVLQVATTVGANDADTVMGTVASITNATTLELTDTSADVFVNGAILYNTSPIKLKLSFEK